MFLKSQKNILYTAIQERGFNLREFQLEESTELRLTHVESGFYYRIYTSEVIPAGSVNNNTEKRFESLFSPNFQARIVTLEGRFPSSKTWPEVMGYVGLWLNWLKSEVEQPDLWAEMEHTPHLFADEQPATDEQFTPVEIKLLEERVAEVEQRILELNLPPEAEAAVVETVRTVPAKATRFTKKELADCIVGSLVKEGFKWGLTTEHMSAAWHACQHFFTLLLLN